MISYFLKKKKTKLQVKLSKLKFGEKAGFILAFWVFCKDAKCMVNCMPYCRNITTNKIMIKAAAGIFILSESAILTTRETNPTAHE